MQTSLYYYTLNLQKYHFKKVYDETKSFCILWQFQRDSTLKASTCLPYSVFQAFIQPFILTSFNRLVFLLIVENTIITIKLSIDFNQVW